MTNNNEPRTTREGLTNATYFIVESIIEGYVDGIDDYDTLDRTSLLEFGNDFGFTLDELDQAREQLRQIK